MKSWSLIHDGSELLRCKAPNYQHARSMLWWQFYRQRAEGSPRFHQCEIRQAEPTTKVYRVRQGQLRARILANLPGTISEMAQACGSSVTAVRSQLQKLEREGLASRQGKQKTVSGREPVIWGKS